MYIMFSTPLIASSSGVATVSAITFGLAPGYTARTCTVGGTTSGYSADRQQRQRDQARGEDHDRQHRGEDRPVDEELGEIHGVALRSAGVVRARPRWPPSGARRAPGAHRDGLRRDRHAGDEHLLHAVHDDAVVAARGRRRRRASRRPCGRARRPCGPRCCPGRARRRTCGPGRSAPPSRRSAAPPGAAPPSSCTRANRPGVNDAVGIGDDGARADGAGVRIHLVVDEVDACPRADSPSRSARPTRTGLARRCVAAPARQLGVAQVRLLVGSRSRRSTGSSDTSVVSSVVVGLGEIAGRHQRTAGAAVDRRAHLGELAGRAGADRRRPRRRARAASPCVCAARAGVEFLARDRLRVEQRLRALVLGARASRASLRARSSSATARSSAARYGRWSITNSRSPLWTSRLPRTRRARCSR